MPYRDRLEHLKHFLGVMSAHDIYVIEQADDKPFNRGKLINVGYLETNHSFFVAHDVDMVPFKVDYSNSFDVTQLASSEIQKVDYLGGVTMYDAAAFEKLGGYHNEYWSRAEDNEMMFNIKRLGVKVNHKHSKFLYLPHERSGPEFIPALWKRAQEPRKVQNQLSVCKYELLSVEKIKTHTLIKVKL